MVGPRRNFKTLPKAKLAPKKGHSHCLVVCCLSDQLQLSESQQSHYIWEVCLANQWDAPKTAMPAAGTDQQKGPNSSAWQCQTTCPTTKASEVDWIGLWSFASSAIFTWPLITQLSLLQASQQLYGGQTLPWWAGGRKCFLRIHLIPTSPSPAFNFPNIRVFSNESALRIRWPKYWMPSGDFLKFHIRSNF